MKKFLLMLVIAVALIIGGVYLFVGDPVVTYNNRKLEMALINETDETITFNKLAEFEWDEMYSFKHTMTKADIEGVLGFESNAIKEPSSDTFIQVIFVKDGKIVANVNGVPTALGYNIIFHDNGEGYNKILYTDAVEFEVENIEKVMRYTEIDKGIVVPPDKQMGIY